MCIKRSAEYVLNIIGTFVFRKDIHSDNVRNGFICPEDLCRNPRNRCVPLY